MRQHFQEPPDAAVPEPGINGAPVRATTPRARPRIDAVKFGRFVGKLP